MRFCNRGGSTMRSSRCAPSFPSIPLVVAGSDLIATIPGAFIIVLGARPAVTTLPHPIDLPNVEIKLLWHERFHGDAAGRWQRDQLVRVFETVKWN